MYPNPAKGVLNISTSSNEAIDVSVYDLLGKQVLNVSKVQTQLNISSLTPGMYFVKMKQGASIATKTFARKLSCNEPTNFNFKETSNWRSLFIHSV